MNQTHHAYQPKIIKKDHKKTPTGNSIGYTSNLNTKLFDEDKDEPKLEEIPGSTPENFISSLWPLLAAKLDRWIEQSLNKKVESIAIAAVDKYVSSTEFQSALSESIAFDLEDIKCQQDELSKEVSDQKWSHFNENIKFNCKQDDIEQYSRRNSIRISGITENKDENTDELVMKTIKEKLNIDITTNDIDRSHRVGLRKPGKPRQIIVKLVRHNKKVEILKNRKVLKNISTNIRIYEDLSKGRMDAIQEINNSAKLFIEKLWTNDGTINVRLNNNPEKIVSLRNLDKLNNFVENLRD